MSKEVCLIATMTPAEGKREQVMELVKDLAHRVKSNEPGCLQYRFTVHQESGDIVLIERYKDQAAFDSHMATEYTTQAFKRVMDESLLGKEVDMKFLDSVAGFNER